MIRKLFVRFAWAAFAVALGIGAATTAAYACSNSLPLGCYCPPNC